MIVVKTTLAEVVGLLLVMSAGHVSAFEGNATNIGNFVFYDNPTEGQMADPWLSPNAMGLDTGLSGVKLTLYYSASDTAAGPWELYTSALYPNGTTTTDSTGYYLFLDVTTDSVVLRTTSADGALVPKDERWFKVVVDTTTLPAGYVQTYSRPDDQDGIAGNSAAVAPVTSQKKAGIPGWPEARGDYDFDFGYVESTHENSIYSLTGNVWFDANWDGQLTLNSTEYGFNSVLVSLYSVNATTGALTFVKSVDTAAFNIATEAPLGAGYYAFHDLPPGKYKVIVSNPDGELPAGYDRTFDYDGIGTPDTAQAQIVDVDITQVNFGYATRRDYCSYTQGGWGAVPRGKNAGALLWANWEKVFGTNAPFVVGGSTYTLSFTQPSGITNFLPTGGTPGQLLDSYTNPTVVPEAGVFAGQVVALKLNIEFSAAGVTRPGFSDLVITSGPFQGHTITWLDALAESVLGGGALPAGVTISMINDACSYANAACDGGTSITGFLK